MNIEIFLSLINWLNVFVECVLYFAGDVGDVSISSVDPPPMKYEYFLLHLVGCEPHSKRKFEHSLYIGISKIMFTSRN